MADKANDSLLQALSGLAPGAYVTLTWVDASQSRRVNLAKRPLPNHNVETRKRTTGRFLCIQRGETWYDLYVILTVEETDDWGEIVSIPVSLVKQVETPSEKLPLKHLVRVYVRRFWDGSVKRLWSTR